jgi:Zn-dependent peptidase ImmA (M78 family)
VEAVDVPRGGKGNRVEQLAENFAAALLMPAAIMRTRWQAHDPSVDLHDWLNETAVDLRVSAVACKWRLHHLGCLSKVDLLDINDQRLVANGRPADADRPPRPFSERFVQRVASAINAGRLSVKRVASLLALSLSELAALLQDYGIEPSFEA